jgi:DNA (cytosine-5)-methyltransferase 1
MNHVDYPFESPTVLSFCPGILGLERGIERAIGKINIAAYVEIEAFIITNLLAGMESGFLDPVPIWTDAKTFDAKPFHNKIHGIIGGYPCQPFSNAGKQIGELDPRHLWPFLRNHIETIKPIWCFFENVEAHLRIGYRTVRAELEQLGYKVEEGIFSAEEVGAPHKRKRLFILAIMGNTESKQQWWNRYQSRKPKSEIGRPSFELVDSDLCGSKEFIQRKQVEEKYPGVRNASETVADTVCERRQLQNKRELSTIKLSLWPRPQGNYQYEWEEPRTIEPGVGCTTNGYNFRNDLLRAFGNSVVEQTAELAFRTLLQKHFNTNDCD